ncbi:MAG: tetratricopeptide repeat protein [Spirochaetaceae bacterium]|nr:tetratricopeptide repeat protein [Spirochaetaceae bacterium]
MISKPSLKLNLLFFLLLLLFAYCGCAGGLSRKEAARLYFNLGNAYFELGQNERAITAYLRALDYDRRMRVASFNLAKSYMEENRFSDAINILNRMLRDEPRNVIILSAKAYCLYRFGDFERALELYEQVLEIDPGNIEALFNSAVIMSEEGSHEEALEKLAMLKTRRIEESVLRRINSKIGEIYYNAGEHRQAIEYLRHTAENESVSIEILKMLFNSYVEIRAYASAVDMGTRILDREEDKDVLFQMSFIYLTAIEDTDRGISFLRQAISAGFSDMEKASYLLENAPRGVTRRISDILRAERLLD